jgi:electron transport complex protein RnfC
MLSIIADSFYARWVHRLRHGVYLPEEKDETRQLPIRHFPFAPALVVPLHQSLGEPALATVVEGQAVTRGEVIAVPDGFLSVAIHAPSSGVVRRIGLAPTIQGQSQPAIFIEPYPGSTQEILTGVPCDVSLSSPLQIIEAIQHSGVVGLGGAGYPTHAKLRIPDGKAVDCIIINGAECEPFLTCDHRIMLEHAHDVIKGVEYLMAASKATRAIIAIESNKADAADAMKAALVHNGSIDVQILDVKYPQGAEKMLIASVLGRKMEPGSLPIDVGVLCFNVASTAEVGHLLSSGGGLVDRVITVGGPAVQKKGNYRIPIGTPLRFVLTTVGLTEDVSLVFLGGPMMGQAVPSLDIPICKNTTAVIAFGDSHVKQVAEPRQMPCIRCGFCVDACPVFLNPSHLGLLAQNQQYETMAQQYHLLTCFECGCCTYVCPSHIPLVQYFRVAKAAVKKARLTVEKSV